MPTPAINAITAIAPTAPSGAKASGSRHNFVETLQVAVGQSDQSPAPSPEKPPAAKREDQPADDNSKVDTRGQSTGDESRAESAEAASQQDGESEQTEKHDAEQTDTEDTLIVSNAAAEQVSVEQASAKQLSDELANAQPSNETTASDTPDQQPQDSESAQAAAAQEGAELLADENSELLTEAETTPPEEQPEEQPSGIDTHAEGDGQTLESAGDPTKLATDEPSNANAPDVEQQPQPENKVADPVKQAAHNTAPAAAAVDQQTVPTESNTKRANNTGQGATESVDTMKPATPQAPEVDIEQQTDLSGKGDAETSSTETQEKPQQSPSSFSEILERATGPASRRGAETEQSHVAGQRVDPQRFVARVTRAFQAAEQRGGTVQLRLAPPELGALRIELNIQNGTLHAKLETETAAAKNVLLDNLPALRDRLAAQEIRVDKFEVDVRQQNSGGQPDWQAQQQQQDAQHQRTSRPLRGTTTTTRSAAEEPGSLSGGGRRTNHDGQFSAVA